MHIKVKCPYCRRNFKFVIEEKDQIVTIVDRKPDCICIEEDDWEMFNIEEKAFDIYDALTGMVSCNF